MGCDIHAFLEFRLPDGDVRSFSSGELLLGRDYALFSALAEVRSRTGEHPMYPPRGLPLEWSSYLMESFFYLVLEEAEDPLWWGGLTVSRAKADEYVARGISSYTDLTDADGVVFPQRLLANPEWHTPSWLYEGEIRAALEHRQLDLRDCNPQFEAVLAGMERLTAGFGAENVWLTFWFDN